jgi:catechol 2,3-dioxygenase-like lactoylglutathione lyase family enzyme
VSAAGLAYHHWTLAVADLDRSAAFYADVLGWRAVGGDPADDVGPDPWGPLPGRHDGPVRTARFVKDGQRVELRGLDGAASDGGSDGGPIRPEAHHLGLSHVTMATGPARAVMAALRSRGVAVREDTLGTFVPETRRDTQFLFEDPDGNLVETYEAGDGWNAFATGPSDAGGANDVGLAHLSHWSLGVADPDRSLAFYREVLGWRQVAALAWEGEGPSTVLGVGPARLTTWLLAAGDQRVEIIHFAAPRGVVRAGAGVTRPGLSHLTVVVDDVDTAAAALERRGISHLTTKGAAGRALVFGDPDGNLIRARPGPRNGEDAPWA